MTREESIIEFQHHGILGQKHGVRNGPPYPLNPEKDYSAAEKRSNGISSIKSKIAESMKRKSEERAKKAAERKAAKEEELRKKKKHEDSIKKAEELSQNAYEHAANRTPELIKQDIAKALENDEPEEVINALLKDYTTTILRKELAHMSVDEVMNNSAHFTEDQLEIAESTIKKNNELNNLKSKELSTSAEVLKNQRILEEEKIKKVSRANIYLKAAVDLGNNAVSLYDIYAQFTGKETLKDRAKRIADKAANKANEATGETASMTSAQKAKYKAVTAKLNSDIYKIMANEDIARSPVATILSMVDTTNATDEQKKKATELINSLKPSGNKTKEAYANLSSDSVRDIINVMNSSGTKNESISSILSKADIKDMDNKQISDAISLINTLQGKKDNQKQGNQQQNQDQNQDQDQDQDQGQQNGKKKKK